MDVFNSALKNPLPPSRKKYSEDPTPGSSPEEPEPAPEADDKKTPPPKKKNSRRKHRNSHLGCGICKKRRIKCDENLPQCFNCIKGKLRCAYLNLDAPARNALRMAQYNQNLRDDAVVYDVPLPYDDHLKPELAQSLAQSPAGYRPMEPYPGSMPMGRMMPVYGPYLAPGSNSSLNSGLPGHPGLGPANPGPAAGHPSQANPGPGPASSGYHPGPVGSALGPGFSKMPMSMMVPGAPMMYNGMSMVPMAQPGQQIPGQLPSQIPGQVPGQPGQIPGQPGQPPGQIPGQPGQMAQGPDGHSVYLYKSPEAYYDHPMGPAPQPGYQQPYTFPANMGAPASVRSITPNPETGVPQLTVSNASPSLHGSPLEHEAPFATPRQASRLAPAQSEPGTPADGEKPRPQNASLEDTSPGASLGASDEEHVKLAPIRVKREDDHDESLSESEAEKVPSIKMLLS